MKISRPADTAAKLAEAKAAASAAEAKVAQLQADRAKALADDDIAAAIRLAAEISSHREAAATHGDRVTLLQSKADAERQAQQLADYEAAVDRMEANLLPRSAAATKLEEAFKALAVAARNFREANETARKCRPANLPYLDDYHLSLNRLAERARACFEPAAAGKGILVRRYSGQPAGTSEFLAMLFDADCRVDGFASKEVEHHKLLVAEIREKGPVERKPDQEAAA